MQNCDCSFTHTELSKFAPFDRYEAGYSNEASIGLIELGINCSSCKYFAKGYEQQNPYEIYDYGFDEAGLNLNHCHVLCGPITATGFCRFWTNCCGSVADITKGDGSKIEEYSQPNKIADEEHQYTELCKKELSQEEFDSSLDSLVNNLSKPKLSNHEVIND